MTRDRQDFIDHLTLRGVSPNTIERYVFLIALLCHFARKRACEIVQMDIRAFLVYLLKERGYAYDSLLQARSALNTYFVKFKKRADVMAEVPRMKRKQRLPEPLSREEVTRLIDSAKGPLHRILLILAYGCGLRVSELVSVKLTDVQFERRMLFVQGAKGGKDRYVPLSDKVIEALKDFIRVYLSWNENGEQSPWLFPSSRNPKRHIDEKTASKAYSVGKKKAGIHRGPGIHTLRHSYATHLLELGPDIKTLQVRMGHKYLQSTMIYLHVARIPHREIDSPYDFIERAGPLMPWETAHGESADERPAMKGKRDTYESEG